MHITWLEILNKIGKILTPAWSERMYWYEIGGWQKIVFGVVFEYAFASFHFWCIFALFRIL